MITSIIRYHTAIHYIMSITRDRFRPYWVSSGGCKKHSIINMLKKTNLPLGAKKKKNAMPNNMIQQYLYHGGHIQGHTHMTWTTSPVTSVSPRAYRCDLFFFTFFSRIAVMQIYVKDFNLQVQGFRLKSFFSWFPHYFFDYTIFIFLLALCR